MYGLKNLSYLSLEKLSIYRMFWTYAIFAAEVEFDLWHCICVGKRAESYVDRFGGCAVYF